MKEVSFITLTNNGYLPYTLNCLASLDSIGVKDITSHTIGSESYMALKSKGYSASLICNSGEKEFQNFRQKNWVEVVSQKFSIIHQCLQKSKFVCFTDGDITYKKAGFIDYCMMHLGDLDAVFQNDTMLNGSHQVVCTGFMFVRSNRATLDFFNPKKIDFDVVVPKNGLWCDQYYINMVKEKIEYDVLPLELFPNGKYYYENFDKINPYLIHFNWVVGHQKALKMRQYDECYSDEFKEFADSQIVAEQVDHQA
jgi:hypothetical protein